MTENNEKEPSIHILLKSAPLVTLPPQAAHSSWPDIRRPAWSALGDKLTRQEQLVTRLLPSNQWISLRLDLKGFSSQSRRLFPSRKYSPLFATAMHNTLLALMTETQASYGFTQSDEITLLLPPHTITSSGRHGIHIRSTGNGINSVVLMQQFMKQRIPLPFLAPEQLGKDTESGKDSSLKPTVQFDARAAGWESLQDAFELILWRAQDCTVNGLSDAVHKSDLPGKKALTELNSWQKVKVLHENGLLPLEEHQAHGVFIERQVKSVEAVDLKAGLNVAVERGVLVHIPGSVLCNFMSGLINLDTREK